MRVPASTGYGNASPVHSVGKNGIANGFDGGHAMADLGNGVHGDARSHVGHRMVMAS
jgi:hypothetical protein